jgi:hypothetical protein
MIGHFDIVSIIFACGPGHGNSQASRPALQMFTGKLAKSKAKLSRCLKSDRDA